MTGTRDGSDDSAGEDEFSDLLPSLDDQAGPARPLSGREFALLVERVEQQFSRPVARRPRRVPGRRLLLVGATFAASAAAAVYGLAVLQGDRASEAPNAAPASPAAVVEAPASEVPAIEAPAGDAPAAPAIAASADAAASEQLGERPAKLNASPSASKTAARSNSVRARSPADDRLATANALRGERRYRDAIGAYLQVIELDPNGMSAAVARVAAAELRLEHFGDVAGAEQLYRQAKTRGGELTAEAQFGLAQVYRARAETTRERRALEEFMARHPESPLVAAARRRLQALEAAQ